MASDREPGTLSVPARTTANRFRIAGLALVALLGCFVTSADAQVVRNFTSRFSQTDRGNFLSIGNTLMTCPDSDTACASARAGTGTKTNNQDFTMVPVDVDTVDPGANSSSATLTIPGGSTVRFAALYWGAISSSAARNQARLRIPGSSTYNSLTASQLDVSGTYYHAFVDVTALVAAVGSGTYTVADVKATTGTNTYAGWNLVVVYTNAAETPHNVNVFDGFAFVASGTSAVTLNLSGFITPPAGVVNTQLSVMAYEGDLGNPGNSLKLNSTTITNAVNPANNFFNSTISLLGANVTTKSPNYVNQLGYDLDTVDASGILPNGATSATATCSPGSDNYLPGVMVFSTEVYRPLIAPSYSKTVSDVNGGVVTPGDILEYTVTAGNTGNDTADAVVLTDAIPANTTYVAGSLSVVSGANAGAKTDASGDDQAELDTLNNRVVFRLGTGATSAAGGSLAVGVSTSIRFRVQIAPTTANGTTISNVSSLTYTERQLGGSIALDSNTASIQVNVPDLTIAKSHSGSFVRGSSGTYSVAVSNTGVGPTLGAVTVTDTLPAGLAPTSATGTGWSCTIVSQTVTCSRADALSASASYPALSIVVSIAQGAAASLTNTATVSGGSEQNTANDSSSDATTIISQADLSISKTGPASVIPGASLVYTVTVTNNGSSDAASVSVADPTPSGLTFVSNTGSCTTAYPCSLGTVAAGATSTITSTYSVPPGYTTPSPISNTATVSSTTTDPVAANNSATSSTPLAPASADVSITKTGPASATPGANLVYTVTITNNGLSNAAAVTVADPTPAGLTFVSNAGDCATSYPCSFGTLSPGATRTITTTCSLPSSYTTPSPIVNTASVSSSTGDPVAANNSSTSSIPVSPRADLSIVKTGPASATPGTNAVYTITVTNNGASDASSVSVADTTPAGLGFVSNSGDCTTAYPCALGTVAAGATRTITTTYSVPASYTTPSPIVNTATVSSSATDPVPGNNSSTSSTPVSPRADLSITKSGPVSAVAGTNVVYTVTVTNNGVSDAAAVSVIDPTPTSLTFVSNAGDCTTSYPCSLGTVAAGATRTITTTYSVPAAYPTSTPIVNTATVSSSATDPVPGNNSVTSSTPVTARADLSITKTGPASVTAGTNLVYTVTVTNNGSSDAAAVSVADPTPTGLVMVSNTGDCITDYPCILGTVEAGATRTITTTYSVPPSYTTPASIVNTATVSSTTTDPVAGNNTSTASTAVVLSADLSIIKTGSGGVTPGTNLIYSVSVTNNGSSDATAVFVADPTPAGVTFVSNTGDCTTAYPCSLGTIAPGVTRTIQTTYLVPSGYVTPDPIVNTATVSSATTDPVAANNSSTASTAVSSRLAEFGITKTGPASVTAGTNAVYTVTILNEGPSDVGSSTVLDPTPPGLTFVSNSGDCTTAYPCSFGTIVAGTTRTITTTYLVPANYAGPDPIVNTADVVSGEADPDNSIESASASTAVLRSADMSVVKTGPASVVAGEHVVYTITVTNSGSSDAESVSVTDPTPAGLTFLSNTGDCTTAWPCSLGTAPAGSTHTITTTYLVPSSYTSPTPIVNTAAVTSSTTDPDSSNNSSSSSTSVSARADLSVTKTGPASVTPGTNAIYTVTVTNNGSSDATAVSLADPTPAGLGFVSNAGDCTTAYPCSLGTLVAGGTRTITTTYSVPSAYTTPSPIVNTATVSSPTTDPSPANNSQASSTPVAPRADLSVTKSGPASATPGANAIYTVTITNNGASDAAAVSVADATPTGLGFVSNAGDCTTSYPCSLGSVAAGATRTITTTYSVPASYTSPDPIVNTASVSSSTTDPVPGNDTATSSTPVSARADLSITKTGAASIVAGTNLVYTVTVTNNGVSDAAAVSVADPAPSGLVLVSNAGDCTTDYPCSLGTIAAGATRTITTTYSVPSSYAGPDPIVNTATVSSPTSDPVAGNNSSTTSTSVTVRADLAITKTAPGGVTPGTNLVYTVRVTNNGSSDAAAVSVADPTPAGLTFVSNAGDCTTAFPCSLGTIAAGGTRTITTTYAVPPSYTTPNPIVNTATVASSTTDPVAGNNSSTASTALSSTVAEFGITKTGPASVIPGTNAVYTVTIVNNGPSDATSAIVTDATPNGLSFVSNSGDCTTAWPCSFGVVPVGATRTITSTFAVPASYTTPDPIVNAAEVDSGDADPVSANNTASTSTTVTPRADLSIAKTGPASVVAGEHVIYTVTVINAGSSDAASVSVADLTPAGLTFVSNSGDCTTAYPCSLGTAPAGSTHVITTTYLVPSSYTAPSPIVNTATVSSSTTDPDAGNNTSTSSTPVTRSADVSISKTGPASATPGTNAVYTVTVTNNGSSDASAVSVADTTPAGLGFVSNAGDCTTSYPCALGTVAAGATRTITTTYSVPSSYLAPSPIVNAASVSSSTTDPVPGNNSSTSSTPVTPRADLSISKTGPASVTPGTNAVYTVTVTNNGVSDAAAVSVADSTPTGLGFVSNAGDCTTSYPCSLGSVAAGATRTITTTYSVPASYTTPSPIVNTATVSSSTTDPDPGNNSQASSTPVSPRADLSITKTGPASVTAGTNIVYTVTVTNSGSSDAADVSVADPTPTGLVLVSNTGDCLTDYPCVLGTVPSGATRTITSTFAVPASYTSPDPIVNTATVSSTTTDPVAANNTSTSSTPLLVRADLSITKTGSGGVTPGTNLVYSVSVTNNGSSDATAVVVADPTPTGVTFVSNTGDCTTAFPCSLGTIAAGVTRTIQTTYLVPSGYTTPDPIVNTATVSSATTDPVVANNTSTASTVVSSRLAEFGITKTGPASVTPGNNIVYTVTILNEGPSDVGSSTVLDATPPGLTFVSNAGDCTTAYPCSFGTIVAGTTRTITSTYLVPPSYMSPDPIVNTAEVVSGEADPDNSIESASASTAVVPSADLSIAKTGPASVVAGDTVVYTVTVSNAGDSDAMNMTVTDPTPPGLVFVSNTGDCTTAYPCVIAMCPAHGSHTITSTYRVPSSYTGPTPIVNTATVSSSTTDPDAGNNSSTSSTSVLVRADLSVTKTGPASVTPGTNAVYTITVTNNGSSDATAVSVADPTPAGLGFVSNAGDCATSFPCPLGTLVAGATRTITTTYSVPSSYTMPDPIVNTATVSSATTDPAAANNTSTSSTPVLASADLSVTNTAVASTTSGANIVYTVTVTNSGASDAAAVSVADPTPAGLIFVSNAGACVSAYPCSLGTVAAGATRTITTTYSVPSSYTTPDPIVSTATVSSSTTDPAAANNVSTQTTSVTRSAGLQILNTGPAWVTPGGNAVYTITVTNSGPSDAAGVVVDDPAPAGLTWLSNSGGCATAYPCSLGTVASGATVTITTTLAVASPYGGTDPAVSTASVSSSTSDPDLSNNTSTASSPLAGNVSGYVFNDLNSDGILDAGETGIAAVVITLTGPSCGAGCSAGTAADGRYSFTGLALGDYTVVETEPLDYTSTTPNSVAATVGTSAVTVNFGNLRSGGAGTGPDLKMIKTHSGIFETCASGLYALQVRNLGPDPSSDTITVIDMLPAGLTYVSAMGIGWTCVADGQIVTCQMTDALASGATSSSIALTVDIGEAAYPTVNNTARVSTAGDPNPVNDTITESATVRGGSCSTQACPVSLKKVHSGNDNAGGEVQYTLQWSNACSADVASVMLTDPLPQTLELLSASSPDATATISGNIATFTLPVLGAKAVGKAFLIARIDPAAEGGTEVENVATLAGPDGDLATASNFFRVRTASTDSSQVACSMRAQYHTRPGRYVKYDVRYTNGSASNELSLKLPDEVDIVKAYPEPDWREGNRLRWDSLPQTAGRVTVNTQVSMTVMDQAVLTGSAAIDNGSGPVGVCEHVSVVSRAKALSTSIKAQSRVRAGSTIRYTARYRDGAGSNQMTVSLPDEVTVVGTLPVPSSGTDRTLTWNDLSLPSGIVRIDAIVRSDVPEGTILVGSMAMVDQSGGAVGAETQTVVSSGTDSGGTGQLALGMSALRSVSAGTTTDISVRYDGVQAPGSVTLQLPPEMTPKLALPSASIDGNTVIWPGLTSSSGALKLRVDVSPAAPSGATLVVAGSITDASGATATSQTASIVRDQQTTSQDLSLALTLASTVSKGLSTDIYSSYDGLQGMGQLSISLPPGMTLQSSVPSGAQLVDGIVIWNGLSSASGSVRARVLVSSSLASGSTLDVSATLSSSDGQIAGAAGSTSVR